MGNYQVSEKNYKAFVHTLIMERLEDDVIWGLNADNPQDALVFSESYFVENIQDEALKGKILDYLLQSGFGHMGKGKPGNIVTIYTFPKDPEGRFKDILEAYSESCVNALAMARKDAISEVRAELESKKNILVFRTYDKVRREVVDQELAKFPYILRHPTENGDWMYAHKNPMQNASQFFRETARKSDFSYRKMLDETIKRFKTNVVYSIYKRYKDNEFAKRYSIGKVEPISNSYITYVSPRIIEKFVESMRDEGFEISYFPHHPKNVYIFADGYKADSDIPLYVNIPWEMMENFEKEAMRGKID